MNRMEIAELLTRLGRDWPVGATVRHESGWTGTVHPAEHCDVGWTGSTGAHAVMRKRLEGLVAVQWRAGDGRLAVAWYRPRVLHKVGDRPVRARARSGGAS